MAFHIVVFSLEEREAVERACWDSQGLVRVLGATTIVAAGIPPPPWSSFPDLHLLDEDKWLTSEPDPELPLDWNLPDDNETDSETLSVGAAVIPAAAQLTSDEGSHSLLDYFAAHVLNGLISLLL